MDKNPLSSFICFQKDKILHKTRQYVEESSEMRLVSVFGFHQKHHQNYGEKKD